jgi:hypothetical protein
VVVIGLSIHTAGQVEVAIKEAAVEELYHTILTAREVTGSSWIP